MTDDRRQSAANVSQPYSDKTTARAFGVLFILSFLFYGTGRGMIETALGSPDLLSAINSNPALITSGALLMAVAHTFTNLSLPVLLLPILKRHNVILAHGYLAGAVAATTVLIVGAVFFMLLIPLAQTYAIQAEGGAGQFDAVATVLQAGGFVSYQLGMAIWGLAGLMLCCVLLQSRIVPATMSLCGIVGYVIFISGTVLELFGYGLGTLLSVPGGLFEITLSVWLIFKGFRAPAHQTLRPVRTAMA